LGASKSRRVARPNRQGEGLIVEYTEIWGPAVWGPGFQGVRGHENCSIFKVSCILDAFYDNLKVTDLVLPRTQALWFVYVIKRTWDGTRGRKTEIILCHTDENITRLRPPPPTFLLSFGRITKFVRKKSGGSRNPPPPHRVIPMRERRRSEFCCILELRRFLVNWNRSCGTFST
jgi:hypothetical protein